MPAALGALRLAALAVAMAVLGCAGDTVAPKAPPRTSLSLLPFFQSRAAVTVPFDKARVTLTRLGTVIGGVVSDLGSAAQGPTALDTTVDFPAGVDSLALRLLVPISGQSETLTLDLWLINAAGDTVYRGGPVSVTATVGMFGSSPAPVALRYVGVGANAASVRIATRAASLFFRDSVVLTASALDGSGQPIPGTPIGWRSLDGLLASVPNDTVGKVVAGVTRGVARIEAMLPTNLADTALVTVQPVPAALSFVSGGGQTGPVGLALPQPLVVRVTAADILPVRNVWVHFGVATGGGKVSADSALTDSLGQAQVTWTLGPTAGVQSVQASVAGVPGTVGVAATATSGTPVSLAFTTAPPSSIAAGAGFGAVVAARDSLGNAATGFTGNVTIAITSGTGKTGATLHGTTTAAAAAGVATFAGLSIDSVGTGYTLTATATGLSSATSTAAQRRRRRGRLAGVHHPAAGQRDRADAVRLHGHGPGRGRQHRDRLHGCGHRGHRDQPRGRHAHGHPDPERGGRRGHLQRRLDRQHRRRLHAERQRHGRDRRDQQRAQRRGAGRRERVDQRRRRRRGRWRPIGARAPCPSPRTRYGSSSRAPTR